MNMQQILCLKSENHLAEELEKCNSLKEVFGFVKECVDKTLRESRAGIDIGLAEMGNKDGALLSAFYPVGSNIIMLNTTPLRRIMETEPALFKPYLFSVLLHEYLHSLGYVNETETRQLSFKICKHLFGDEHPVTQISFDIRKFFPYLLYPGGHPGNKQVQVIEVDDLDYIG